MASCRVVGVIPARLDSTRFPRKVLAEVAGKPLVRLVFERLSLASGIDEVFVATDSAEVERTVSSFGGQTLMVRERCATGSDRVAAAIRDIEADVVVNLQADQPMISPSDIDRTVEALAADGGLDLATLAFGADDEEGYLSPDVVKVVAGAGGRVLYFSRAPVPHVTEAAGVSPLYLHHVGIYCFRRRALERFASLSRGTLELRESLEQLRAVENGMSVGLLMTDRQTRSVDRPDDVAEVERLISAG
ncbi:MAG: 3-deoxy-manno-octulosonate cytidylyltransferase [Candidatus Eisenbacteria bacterium]